MHIPWSKHDAQHHRHLLLNKHTTHTHTHTLNSGGREEEGVVAEGLGPEPGAPYEEAALDARVAHEMRREDASARVARKQRKFDGAGERGGAGGRNDCEGDER